MVGGVVVVREVILVWFFTDLAAGFPTSRLDQKPLSVVQRIFEVE